MATKSKVEKVDKTEEEKSTVFELSRKILLAAIGAIALAQDEMEEFVKKLVERGEIAESDGKKLMRELVEKRKKQTKEAEDEVTRRIDETLDRMNVPTKADIDSLSEKITVLTKKVDELKKAQQS